MKKSSFLFLALFGVYFCAHGLDAATAPADALTSETPLAGTVVVPSRGHSVPKKPVRVLTDSGNCFRYSPLRVIDPRPLPQLLGSICRGAENLGKSADQFLRNQGEIWKTPHIREWGILYANLPRLTGKPDVVPSETAKYALALLCDERYEEAEQILRKLAEKVPDDYGTMILLGALSVRNQEYFSYLKKAFAVNPTRCANFIEWQCQNLDLLQKLPEEWDFVGAYLPLLLQYREQIDFDAIHPMALMRLNKAIREKYFDENGRIRPEYRDQDGQWTSLCVFLMKHMH